MDRKRNLLTENRKRYGINSRNRVLTVILKEKRQYIYRKNFCMFYVIKEEVKTVRIIKVAYSPSNLDEE